MNLYGSYKNARNASWQVIVDYNITSLPVDVVSLANQAGFSLVKNSDVDQLNNNESGISLNDGNNWYIIYNDTMSRGRIRFTIAHEIGHIFLGHTLVGEVNTRKTFDETKPIMEKQADIFASRLLAPACVLWGLDIHTPKDIASICNISLSSAKIRAERMELLYKRNKFLTSPLEKQVFNQFKDFIKQFK